MALQTIYKTIKTDGEYTEGSDPFVQFWLVLYNPCWLV